MFHFFGMGKAAAGAADMMFEGSSQAAGLWQMAMAEAADAALSCANHTVASSKAAIKARTAEELSSVGLGITRTVAVGIIDQFERVTNAYFEAGSVLVASAVPASSTSPDGGTPRAGFKAVEPETVEPEAVKLEPIEAETVEAETDKIDPPEPEIAEPETDMPEAAAPETVEAGADELELTETETVEPEGEELEPAEPEMVVPEMTEPETGSKKAQSAAGAGRGRTSSARGQKRAGKSAA